jgi:hypothetical protein
MTGYSFGLLVRGGKGRPRKFVRFAEAFAGYCSCHPSVDPAEEAYLSAFAFRPEMHDYMRANGGSTAGFAGSLHGKYIWIDQDSADLGQTLLGTRKIAHYLLDLAPELHDEDLLVFFSGKKGTHIGVPVCWAAEPGTSFHVWAKAFASRIAATVGVPIDLSVYDRVQIFRAPNSRHPDTGLHKVRLSVRELELTADRVRGLATEPRPFELRPVPGPTAAGELQGIWAAAVAETPAPVAAGAAAVAAGDAPHIVRATLRFIRGDVAEGERADRLFEAAANLAEMGVPLQAAEGLLTEAARDSGLAPREVRDQITGGYRHVARRQGNQQS